MRSSYRVESPRLEGPPCPFSTSGGSHHPAFYDSHLLSFFFFLIVSTQSSHNVTCASLCSLTKSFRTSHTRPSGTPFPLPYDQRRGYSRRHVGLEPLYGICYTKKQPRFIYPALLAIPVAVSCLRLFLPPQRRGGHAEHGSLRRGAAPPGDLPGAGLGGL